jgi:Multiple resistance and pH regulation protein F (MrpF / PhaF)
MREIVSRITLVTLGLSVLITFIRLVKGPTLPDRIVAMDLLGVLVVGLIVVLAAWSGVPARERCWTSGNVTQNTEFASICPRTMRHEL